MILAAGILLQAQDGRVLLLRRSAQGDHAGEWGLPGGKVEGKETLADAANREAREEIGINVKALDGAGPFTPVCRRVADGVDWSTFRVQIPEAVEPTLNDEHDEFEWADPANPPSPLHPGAKVVLARIGMDELAIARAMAAGELESPQRYENMALVAMRITGTGMAYRAGLKEHVWRDPKHYLTDDFLARCNGLPVVVEHPEGNVLNSDEFANRVAGTIMLPFVKQNEVWGIAKIFDASTIAMIEEHRLSTSPAVVFRDPGVNQTERLEDGETLLIEGKPSLLDHLAICEQGVWDKGGEPTGVASSVNNGGTAVADETNTEANGQDEAAMKAKADAEAGQKLDRILAHVDSMAARMDALEAAAKPDAAAMVDPAQEAEEAEVDPKLAEAAADGDGEYPPEIASMPVATEADRFRKDAACAGYKADMKMKADAAAAAGKEAQMAKADSARAVNDVAALRKRLGELEARVAQPTEDDSAALADAQVKADAVYAQHGSAAPRPLQGEAALAYRRRLAQGMQRFSPAWKEIDLAGLPAPALDVAVATIYADAATAARNPTDVQPHELREIVSMDTTGRRITSFVGQPRAWMDQFGANRRRLTGINNGSR